MYYAQNSEDQWLDEHWAELGLPAVGTFVEIGVGDGVNISNSLWLEERGWNGLLIEPDIRQHANILARRRAKLITCAIGKYHREFVATENPELSGFLRPMQEGMATTVSVRGLQEVLNDNCISAVDVLSIDTEGTELEVWSTLDLSRIRPSVVFVEWATSGIGENKQAITEQLDRDGYMLAAELGCNLSFVPRRR